MAVIELTVKQIMNLGLWDKVCEYKGWEPYILSEGKISEDELVTFDDEFKKDSETILTRERLIELCEKAIVDESKWDDRDSSAAQMNIGQAWALLKAGCEYQITSHNKEYINLDISYKDFGSFERSKPNETESFYIPSEDRLKYFGGNDWY